MRIGAARAVSVAMAIVALAATAGCSGGFFRHYEYEEELHLSLDGSAEMYVNASLAALNALRGTSFDTSPAARFDAAAIQTYFDTPQTRVTRVTQSRRRGRRYAHIRLEVDDLRRLRDAPPFAWSTYQMTERDGRIVYLQEVGAAAGSPPPAAEWSGAELVAFQLRPPSKIEYHNAGPANLRRGNTLVWEQPLVDRLRGTPLRLEATIETQSILYRTLWLFALTGAAVAVFFGAVLMFVRGRGGAAALEPSAPPGRGPA